MNIQVRGRNVEVTEALKDYIAKRVGKVEKYLDNIREAQVTLAVERGFHRVEVTIPVNGIILRGEESTPDMYASVDLVVEKLEKQVQKHKGRLIKRLGKSAGETPDERFADYDYPQIVRTKRFDIKPMTVDEAVLQMNLLGHSFFVFSNSESEQVNVLYKRKDGNYGLIEPEF
ncbi:MAG TPA: ribosome-associated translation inhibitor RaiA [Desulfotomaculum sp.]|nr:MAG: Sigma 54 modulation protein/ribosomal protein S30EA [Desulfotomaculum sp. 46_296]HAG11726.1 ribosome-associated translation inhibitor RaiA [Desulfotomaculum sp.]HBY03433.1 ribosome-associated translation inhibitor RaiA [Desulfotomaculum sp.]